MNILNQKQKIIAMAIISVIVIIIGYYYINSTKEIYTYTEEKNVIRETEEDINEEETSEKIIVHITGGVKNQGIVEVKENARINDVIEAAGGVTEDADLSDVNLAYKIEDGQKIYIPIKEDTKENTKEDTNEKRIEGSYGTMIIHEAGEKVIQQKSTSTDTSKIDINKASAAELEKISGIGSQTAQKIIDYREKNGKFKTIEDIKNVSGIGDAKFETIKNFIRV